MPKSSDSKSKSGGFSATKLILVALVLGVLFFLFQTKGTDEDSITMGDIGQKMKDLVGTTDDYTEQQKQTYTKAVQEQIKKYKNQISLLKIKASNLDSTSRAATQKKINTLSAEVDSLQQKAAKLSDSSGQAWSDLKSGLDEAVGKLKEGVADAKANFDKK